MPSHGQAGNALVYKPASDLIWLHDPAARSGWISTSLPSAETATNRQYDREHRQVVCGGVQPLIVLGRQRQPCLVRAPPKDLAGVVVHAAVVIPWVDCALELTVVGRSRGPP
jgi:hypothetical protein